MCRAFLTDGEKDTLMAFVKTPFRNYNKSKEKLDSHETNEYHKRSLDRAACARAQLVNIERRIHTHINTTAQKCLSKYSNIVLHRRCRAVVHKAANCFARAPR